MPKVKKSTQRACVMVLASVLAHPVLCQEKLVPAVSIPNEIAYIALFYVTRSAPAPHWDHETTVGWLAERGVTGTDSTAVILTANTFYNRHQEAESRLMKANERHKANPLSVTARAERARIREELRAIASTSIAELDLKLTPDGRAKLAALISEIKSDIKMKAL